MSGIEKKHEILRRCVHVGAEWILATPPSHLPRSNAGPSGISLARGKPESHDGQLATL